MQALEVIVPYFRTKRDSIKVLYGTIPIGQKGDPDLKAHVAPAKVWFESEPIAADSCCTSTFLTCKRGKKWTENLG